MTPWCLLTYQQSKQQSQQSLRSWDLGRSLGRSWAFGSQGETTQKDGDLAALKTLEGGVFASGSGVLTLFF